MKSSSPKLVLLNGPRHCGKDTAAVYVAQEMNACHFKFSFPIKEAVKTIFDLSSAEVDYLESIKTTPTSLLLGKSYVDVQISFSESWAKQFFCQDIFGYLALRRLRKIANVTEEDIFVSSDSGFACEAWPAILEFFGVDNTLLIRIERDGKTFAGDSRSYIEFPGVETVTIYNNGDILEYQRNMVALIEGWLSFRHGKSECADGFCPMPGVRQGPAETAFEGMFKPVS